MTRLLSIAFFTLLFCGVDFGQCPTLSVIGPAGVTPSGDSMTFRLESGRSDLKYSWTVSAGTITGGQGTPVIVVITDSAMAGSTVTATVDIQGLRPDCARSASESAPVAHAISFCPIIDEWGGRTKPNDVRGRLDAFFAELSNNPLNTGIMILLVTEKESFDSGNKRLQLVVNHAKFREFDLNRIWFVLERSEYSRTKVLRVPPGGEMIPCDGACITIKGGDL